ncbi:ClpX C4-type zinc finger protein, partial [[Eubacterium] siraeum]
MLRCSFCERTEDQVERIIYGASGCICNDCIVASYQMLM